MADPNKAISDRWNQVGSPELWAEVDKLREALAALKRLLANHYDEDGVIDIFSGGAIVGIDGNNRMQLRGSFIAALEEARAAVAKVEGR